MKRNALLFATLLIAILGMLAVGKYLNRIHGHSPSKMVGDVRGVAAPNFDLATLDGHRVKLSDYRGKVVLVNFWATWCKYCRMEMPWFSDFERQYGGRGFAVVGISLDQNGWAVVTPFLSAQPVPYRIVLGDMTTARAYGLGNAMPNSFLLDRQGRVAMATEGLVDRDATIAKIGTLLSEKP